MADFLTDVISYYSQLQSFKPAREAGRPLSETRTSCNGKIFDECASLLFSTPEFQARS
jgi:hypothetical protein